MRNLYTHACILNSLINNKKNSEKNPLKLKHLSCSIETPNFLNSISFQHKQWIFLLHLITYPIFFSFPICRKKRFLLNFNETFSSLLFLLYVLSFQQINNLFSPCYVAFININRNENKRWVFLLFMALIKWQKNFAFIFMYTFDFIVSHRAFNSMKFIFIYTDISYGKSRHKRTRYAHICKYHCNEAEASLMWMWAGAISVDLLCEFRLQY